MNLEVSIGNKSLANPVGVASGTFGYGSEYEQLIDLSCIGAIFTKAVTLEPRPGNDIPRIIETPSGLLNSIGLANVGVERFVAEKMPFLREQQPAVIVNVAGSTEDEYRKVVELLEPVDGIWGYEINVSCPNVKHGGLAFGTEPTQVERLTAALRRTTKRPLIIKLTPNVTDITAVARAAEAGGADGLSCINTLVGMVIDVKKRRPVLPAGTGGLSGPAVRPVGVAMTWRVSRAVSIPVIGLGGIMSADDALQYLLAGASAVQIGTANFVDPRTAAAVLDGIREFCEREGIERAADIAGLLS
ncbi:MAG: dihydroorotate dehydrogenase [Chitinivibrionales bacterium]|nr:dihydroorotate dehydrogenase [Chitinivibrionales bacterium]